MLFKWNLQKPKDRLRSPYLVSQNQIVFVVVRNFTFFSPLIPSSFSTIVTDRVPNYNYQFNVKNVTAEKLHLMPFYIKIIQTRTISL